MNIGQKVTFNILIIPNETDELKLFVLKKYNEYIGQNHIEIDKTKLYFNDLDNVENINYLQEKATNFIINFINKNSGLNKKLNLKKLFHQKVIKLRIYMNLLIV